MTLGKVSGGGAVYHLEDEMETHLFKDLKPGEENDIDDDDLEDDEEQESEEDDAVKKEDKKKDKAKKIDAKDEKELQRPKQKEEEEDDQEGDDDAPTDEKQEEDRVTKTWCGKAAKVNTGARKDKAVKAGKDDDHSEEVLDENNRYHMTSTFRHASCEVDGSDEAWDEDAHKKESEWEGNEQGDGYDHQDDNLIEDGGELFE